MQNHLFITYFQKNIYQFTISCTVYREFPAIFSVSKHSLNWRISIFITRKNLCLGRNLFSLHCNFPTTNHKFPFFHCNFYVMEEEKFHCTVISRIPIKFYFFHCNFSKNFVFWISLHCPFTQGNQVTFSLHCNFPITNKKFISFTVTSM